MRKEQLYYGETLWYTAAIIQVKKARPKKKRGFDTFAIVTTPTLSSKGRERVSHMVVRKEGFPNRPLGLWQNSQPLPKNWIVV